MLSSIAALQTSFFNFSLTPYYSSSWDETSCSTSHWISLIMSIASARSQKNSKKYKKMKLSHFFTRITFFAVESKFLHREASGWAGRAAARKNFLILLNFGPILYKKLIQSLKNSIFQKFSKSSLFFRSDCKLCHDFQPR